MRFPNPYVTQLCTSEIAAHLELGAPEHFRYLRESGCVAVPGLNDKKDFQEVEEVRCTYAYVAMFIYV